MRNNQNYFHKDDDWDDIMVMFILLVYGGTFIWFMFRALMIEHSAILPIILVGVFGFFVYTFSALFITIAVLSLIRTIQKIKKHGFTWRRLLIAISGTVALGLGQLVFEFLYWGIIQHDAVIRNKCLPILAISILFTVIYVKCLIDEV